MGEEAIGSTYCCLILVHVSPGLMRLTFAQSVSAMAAAGVISFDEFKQALPSHFGQTTSDEDIEGLFKSIAYGGEGFISYSEFIAATLCLHSKLEMQVCRSQAFSASVLLTPCDGSASKGRLHFDGSRQRWEYHDV